LFFALFVFLNQAVDQLVGEFVIGEDQVQHLIVRIIRSFAGFLDVVGAGFLVIVFIGLAGKVHADIREETRPRFFLLLVIVVIAVVCIGRRAGAWLNAPGQFWCCLWWFAVWFL